MCQICTNIVLEPKECGECQSVFCVSCIDGWKYINNSCPKKCKGDNPAEWRKMHRVMKSDMHALKFKCKNPGCEKVLKYQDAITHINTCDKAMVAC